MTHQPEQLDLNRPLVSVVVPTHNRSPILGRCLSALANQTYPNFEVIVVDDASTDDTPALLDQLTAANPGMNLRCLRNDANLGANASRNRAVREALGRFVAFLDSDCMAQPDWLEKLLAGFESDAVAAVTGRVTDPPPRNIYEFAFKGTHRVHGRGPAPRLVAGNMCIRRELLLECPLDEDFEYGCDEEGIYLRLRVAGYEQRLVPDAVVHHEHFYDRRAFSRQAHVGGRAAARLVFKYRLPPRLDLLPFMMTYLTLPLLLLDVRAAAVPILFFAIALAAITYNDLARKGKTVGETLRSFPMLLAYYHVRLFGYASETLRLRLGIADLPRVRLSRPPVPPGLAAARSPKPDASLRFSTLSSADDLRDRSVRGSAVTLFAQAVSFVLVLVWTAVLARLLTPEDFGLIAMVLAITAFVEGFRDLGLGMSTVQRLEITHEQISTLFWVNAAFGLVTALVIAAASPVIAWFYGEPRLLGITLSLSLAFIWGGLSVQHQALLTREMRFATLAWIKIASGVIGFAASIFAALSGLGYWALVIMQLVPSACGAAGVWLTYRWRPGPPVRHSGVRSMLAFGGHLAGFNILNHVVRNLDNVLIGWYWGAGPLGFYSRAYQLLLVPIQQINTPMTNVAVPGLSRLQDDPDRYRAYYGKAVLFIAACGMPLVAFMFASAERLVRVLLGSQWTEAVPIFRVLGPAAMVGTLAVATSWAFVSLGQTKRQFRWQLLAAVVTVPSFALGLRSGPIGVGIACSIAFCALWLPGVVFCFRGTPLRPRDLLEVLWRPAVASILAGVVGFYVAAIIPMQWHSALGLAIEAAVFVAAYATIWLLLPQGREMFREAARIAKELRTSPPNRINDSL